MAQQKKAPQESSHNRDNKRSGGSFMDGVRDFFTAPAKAAVKPATDALNGKSSRRKSDEHN